MKTAAGRAGITATGDRYFLGVSKKVVDSRQEPLPAGTPPEPNYKVDRVFAPAPRARSVEEAQAAAAALLERRRASPTSPPPTASSPASGTESPDSELSLRRQLSRLQRQLAEAQRELANKDDEIASSVEARMEAMATSDALQEQLKQHQERIAELEANASRMDGIEQRLQEANSSSDEMEQFLEREREARMAAQAKVDELTRSFDETRELWNSERQMLEERAKQELAQLDGQHRGVAEAAEQATLASTARLIATHQAEVAELKAGHERSLSALRGELEPRALEARTLAEERERLAAQISALQNDAVREAAARDEAHARDKAQAAEEHALAQAATARAHASELARAGAESGAQILGLQQSLRSAEALAKGLEEGTVTLRETQLKVQRELAETKERAAQLEASVKSLEERLAAAAAASDAHVDEKRQLREALEASTMEARRNALDRLRFVAYLEEGLALLGALPPSPEPPIIEIEPDES